MCMTPTFQINFSYLNSLRIYITRLYAFISRVYVSFNCSNFFFKFDAMVMYNTTDTQQHETHREIFYVQTEYQI